jgi:quercetin 2,3-dioxygenase
MNRKEFLKKGLLGTGLMVASTAMGKTPLAEAAKSSHPSEVGFNHLPPEKTEFMENMIIHRAGTRGHANHGWLKSYHTFSFAGYYNPERVHFGALRVLNDDEIAGGTGFGMHPHDNMEIISIPLEGALEHKDSMGNNAVIHAGEIQVMSAGTGVRHSEYNHYKDKSGKFLQIWVFPNKRNVKPRYDQILLKAADRKNKFQQIVSPNPNDEGTWIHQDAWFHLGTLDAGIKQEYKLKKKGNGVYAFLISGNATINGQQLNTRDAIGIWNETQLKVAADTKAEILLMEVPMAF